MAIIVVLASQAAGSADVRADGFSDDSGVTPLQLGPIPPALFGKVTIKNSNGKFVTAEHNNGERVVANRDVAAAWEEFTLIDAGSGGKVNLKSSNGKFVSADQTLGGKLVANRDVAAAWETFIAIQRPDGYINLKASNGKFVTADRDNGGVLVANRDAAAAWEGFNITKR